MLTDVSSFLHKNPSSQRAGITLRTKWAYDIADAVLDNRKTLRWKLPNSLACAVDWSRVFWVSAIDELGWMLSEYY